MSSFKKSENQTYILTNKNHAKIPCYYNVAIVEWYLYLQIHLAFARIE